MPLCAATADVRKFSRPVATDRPDPAGRARATPALQSVPRAIPTDPRCASESRDHRLYCSRGRVAAPIRHAADQTQARRHAAHATRSADRNDRREAHEQPAGDGIVIATVKWSRAPSSRRVQHTTVLAVTNSVVMTTTDERPRATTRAGVQMRGQRVRFRVAPDGTVSMNETDGVSRDVAQVVAHAAAFQRPNPRRRKLDARDAVAGRLAARRAVHRQAA